MKAGKSPFRLFVLELSSGGMVVLYDGVCLLCNRFVQFLIQRTSADACRFAPLQAIPAFRESQDSVWVQTLEGRWLSESDAVLYVLRQLPGYRWTSIGKWIPKSWRDALYRWVARHRYGWFGQASTCIWPEPGRMLSETEIQALRNQF